MEGHQSKSLVVSVGNVGWDFFGWFFLDAFFECVFLDGLFASFGWFFLPPLDGFLDPTELPMFRLLF